MEKQHCTGCTEADSWDLPQGRTHQMDTIEHPLPHTSTVEENQSDEMLRDKFRRWWEDEQDFTATTTEIIDWWLSLLHSRDTAIREELLGKIEELEVLWLSRTANSDCIFNKAGINKSQVINLLTEVLNK
jgi:hypothetical protein